MIWGVRGRITALAAVVVLIVLSLTGAALVAAQRLVLTDNVDEVLQRHSAAVTRAVDEGSLGAVIPGQGDGEAFALVVAADGGVVASTAHTAPGLDLAAPQGETRRLSRSASDGLEYRVLSVRHGEVVIHTGTPLDDVNESVTALARGLIVAVPSAALLLAGLVWTLVGRVLRPVERIRSQVAEITSSRLDRRVPEPSSRDEISRLARTMNGMLERLQASVARQERFVADASHELRTPLTRIRTELEVDLAHPESADPWKTHRSVLDEANTLQGLIDDLLILARSDGEGDASQTRRAAVDLDDIVLAESSRYGPGQVVDVSGVSAGQVTGDAAQLARVVRNLLDNAVQHGGGRVTVALAETNGEAVLSVADDGPGIPAALRDTIFERFVTVDEARNGTRPGSGLGLAIARQLVTAHGGSIRVDPDFSPGTRFVVRLPLRVHSVS